LSTISHRKPHPMRRRMAHRYLVIDGHEVTQAKRPRPKPGSDFREIGSDSRSRRHTVPPRTCRGHCVVWFVIAQLLQTCYRRRLLHLHAVQIVRRECLQFGRSTSRRSVTYLFPHAKPTFCIYSMKNAVRDAFC